MSAQVLLEQGGQRWKIINISVKGNRMNACHSVGQSLLQNDISLLGDVCDLLLLAVSFYTL